MRINILPIYKKEIKLYLQSPSVYVVGGLFFALAGLFFQDILVFFSQMSVSAQMRYRLGFFELNMTQFVVRNTFSLINFLLLFVVPILTMRLFAEEKKSGTFELLVTYPFRDWELLIGKYLAALSIIALFLLISVVYALLMIIIGQPEVPVILSSYLGIFLLAMAYVAYGIFASSLTENQIVSAILTFAGLLVLYLIGDLAAAETGFLSTLLDAISIRLHAVNFTIGVIETKDIAYFILFTVLFLFLTARVLESRHWRV